MAKLNNKGFAISTMLYGILIMIILILYLILSIMNSGLNSKKMIVDEEKTYLNKCANRQAYLEFCYKSHPSDQDCSEEYEAYTNCMGYEANSTYSASTASIKETVLDYADVYGLQDPTNMLIPDEDISGRYVYAGANPRNYIKIGSRMGRIISIEADGTVKVVITDRPITNVKIDAENGAGQDVDMRWKSSVALNELRKEYSRLDYTNKMTNGFFYLGNVDSTASLTLTNIYNNIHSKYLNNKTYLYGTITLEDYLKASAYAHDKKYNCKISSGSPAFKMTSMIDDTHNCNKDNWLGTLSNVNKVWTSTAAANVNTYYVIGGGYVTLGTYDTPKNMYLVVFLGRNLQVSTAGTGSYPYGSSTNPFIVTIK